MSELGIIAALGSAASWAVGSVVFKKLGEKAQSIAMTTVKALLSAAILLVFILVMEIDPFVSKHSLMVLAASGIIGIALGDSFFFASLKRLSPIVLSIILFAGPDIFYGVLGFLILGEMPPLQIWAGIILILSGLGCLLFPLEVQNSDGQKTRFAGILFALASLFCMAVSMVIVKPVLHTMPTLTATMYRMLFGGLFLLGCGVASNKIKTWEKPFLNKDYNFKFLYSVLIVTFGGFWLSLVAIKNCDVVVASTLMSLEPLLILLYMIIFCKHKAKFREYLGILLAIAGLALLVIYSR